jgi:hypothetical protein
MALELDQCTEFELLLFMLMGSEYFSELRPPMELLFS